MNVSLDFDIAEERRQLDLVAASADTYPGYRAGPVRGKAAESATVVRGRRRRNRSSRA